MHIALRETPKSELRALQHNFTHFQPPTHTPCPQTHHPQNFHVWNSHAQHTNHGYSRQRSVAIPYVIQQRWLNKQTVRSAISATAGVEFLFYFLKGQRPLSQFPCMRATTKETQNSLLLGKKMLRVRHSQIGEKGAKPVKYTNPVVRGFDNIRRDR